MWNLKHLQTPPKSGVCIPIAHGNKGTVPWNIYSPEMLDMAVQFIKNYAVIYGLSTPAAPPSRVKVVPTYLPTSFAYQSIRMEYGTAQQAGETAIGYQTFLRC